MYVNGLELEFDMPPLLENGRILVPLRIIFEALGASVEWSNETSTVTAVKEDVQISLQIDSNVLNKNGSKIMLDVPAKIVNGRTLVPVRAVSEGLGAKVEWDETAQIVRIWTE